MTINQLAKLYENNSVSICGKKGRGKDMLTANVIARRKPRYYISNVDYRVKGKTFIRFDPKLLQCGNDYRNFLQKRITRYVYPYPDNVDIYISDTGVYFPAQYCNQLNNEFRDIPTFCALSRHLGDCYLHTNAQALNRVWDKIREQSDTYIECLSCKVIGKIVIQRIRIYERYESALASIPPCRLSLPLTKEERLNVKIERERYRIQYGEIKEKLLIYVNKSNYDTRIFKTLLEVEDDQE